MSSYTAESICKRCGRPLLGTEVMSFVAWVSPEEPGHLIHGRCGDWRTRPYMASGQLEACRLGWSKWSTTTRQAATAGLARLADIEREWPPDDDDGFERLTHETITLRLAVANVLRRDPGARKEMRRMGG